MRLATQSRPVTIRGTHGTTHWHMTAGDYTARIVEHEPDSQLPRHGHGFANMTLVLAGALREQLSRRELTCRAGMLFFRAPEEPHRNSYGRDGCRSLIIDVPVSSYGAWRMTRPLYDRSDVIGPGAASRLAARIADELRQPDDCSELAIEGLILEVLASAIRQKRATPHAAAREGRAMDQALEYLAAHPTSRTTLATLARVTGLPPMVLAREFRRQHGRTPAAAQRTFRAEWAADELSRTQKPIALVAAEAGFTDQSHLTRVFRRIFGMTPRAYRMRTKAG